MPKLTQKQITSACRLIANSSCSNCIEIADLHCDFCPFATDPDNAKNCGFDPCAYRSFEQVKADATKYTEEMEMLGIERKFFLKQNKKFLFLSTAKRFFVAKQKGNVYEEGEKF